MSQTAILQWQLPAYQDRAWYSVWESMMDEIDTDLFTSIEDSHGILYGGGTISLNALENTVSWTENLDFYSVLFPGRVRVVPGSLSNVMDKYFLVIPVSRPMTSITSGDLSAVESLADVRSRVFVAQRRGDSLIMRPRYHAIIAGT
jgi:hypothetical protein